MTEKEIERKLVSEVKKRGGLCLKWACPSFDGVPDRIVLLPGRKIGFVELKAPGKKPRPLQASRHRLFARLGFAVFVIDSPDQIAPAVDEIGGTKNADNR
ncbi:MAG: VRR-NUC domain-containing protein [Lachnospiraceae bacterium]|nr:VRR-NUC domain-containing protein [Lachnospiraceae bacterium]